MIDILCIHVSPNIVNPSAAFSFQQMQIAES
jgi:hypothetical protein